MVGDDNGRFSIWQFITRDVDLPAIEDLEYGLDPIPIAECDGRGGVVDEVGEEIADGQEEGEDEVHDHQVQCPWADQRKAAQEEEEIPDGHFFNIFS